MCIYIQIIVEFPMQYRYSLTQSYDVLLAFLYQYQQFGGGLAYLSNAKLNSVSYPRISFAGTTR